VGLHADGDHRRVDADDAAAQHDDVARRDSRDAAEQDPASAERLLEVLGARLHGEPAGDLAHRREQREPAFGVLDGLVGDRQGTGCSQGVGDAGVRREVEVREQGVVVAQEPELLALRLLDLEHQIGAPRCRSVADGRAHGAVSVVVEPRAVTGRRFDDDLMSRVYECVRAGRGERDAVLVDLYLAGHSDSHHAPSVIPAESIGRQRRTPRVRPIDR